VSCWASGNSRSMRSTSQRAKTRPCNSVRYLLLVPCEMCCFTILGGHARRGVFVCQGCITADRDQGMRCKLYNASVTCRRGHAAPTPQHKQRCQ